MSERLIWAYKPLPALNNETGFVACEDALAIKLIEAGDVQDPAVGAHHLKEIDLSPSSQGDDYETKVMSPRKRAKAAE